MHFSFHYNPISKLYIKIKLTTESYSRPILDLPPVYYYLYLVLYNLLKDDEILENPRDDGFWFVMR